MEFKEIKELVEEHKKMSKLIKVIDLTAKFKGDGNKFKIIGDFLSMEAYLDDHIVICMKKYAIKRIKEIEDLLEGDK